MAKNSAESKVEMMDRMLVVLLVEQWVSRMVEPKADQSVAPLVEKMEEHSVVLLVELMVA